MGKVIGFYRDEKDRVRPITESDPEAQRLKSWRLRERYARMKRREEQRMPTKSETELTSAGIPILKLNQRPEPLKNPPMPAFNYCGGKFPQRKKIVKMMPPHKTYVEPFAGAANVLLAKPPSPKEVIGDKDRSIAKIHKTIAKTHKSKPWKMTPSRRKWEEIKRKPLSQRTAEEQAYFLDHSYGGMGKNYNDHGKSGPFDIIELHKRLHDVDVVDSDFATTMKRWDSEATLHYLDPPYTTGSSHFNVNDVTPEKVKAIASQMKGKVMVSYDNTPEVRKVFHGRDWKLHKLHVYRGVAGKGSVGSNELLITNFDVRKERKGLEPYDGKLPKLEWHKVNGEWFPK